MSHAQSTPAHWSPPDRAGTGAARHPAFRLLSAHIGLVAALGAYYARIRLPGTPVFVTEAVLALAVLLGYRRILAVPRDRTTHRVVVFLVIGSLWFAATGPGQTLAGMKAFSFFVYAGFYFVLRGTVVTDEDRWRVLRIIASASLVGAAIGIWKTQYGSVPFLTDGADIMQTSTGSTRWLPGEFALYGAFAMSICVVSLVVRRDTSLTNKLCIIAGITEIVLAQHRSAAVALLGSAFVVVALLLRSPAASRRLVKWAVVAALAAIVGIYAFGNAYLEQTIVRLHHTTDTADANAAWRLLSWAEVLGGIRSHPFGHGFATWDFFFNQFDPLSGSHNAYLDLAYRVGLPGLITFLSIPLAVFALTHRAVRSTGPSAQAVGIAACACLCGLLVYAFFNVVFVTPFMSIFFWVLLGVAADPVLSDKSNPAPRRACPKTP